jgi:hypothetical protein
VLRKSIIIIITVLLLLLTAIGLTPGGSSNSTHLHKKQYTEYRERNINNNKKNREVLAVPRLCELYPGIYLTTEKKAWKTLS